MQITRFELLFLPPSTFILKKKSFKLPTCDSHKSSFNIPEEGAEQPKGQAKNLYLDTSKRSF